ncbi:protein of unknown function [Gemmobacter megaterium]|uniref:DUF4167 domain-containing protein n=1 Tax=Gemmobacter megaterium TaxID=1086013 RepID=A0A1N7K6J9_9RHOB|nr:DUF4167 domain-containing protein [Gemmobacter megaterium]GGE00606.1 hypothetical protein GCM10011345_02410 [Gemmobacter megaterium]SIS57225.1 protein of unknown function [Gemmobacter megaterium]
MRSSKSRSRSKQNRPRSIGNIVNRVFDSSGPEGKVRGTPQQIIEKYQALARDAQLSNDRVAAENFLQHAEHYTRMLGEAMRELAAEQEARRQQHGGQGANGNGNGHGQPQGGQDRPQYQPRRDEREDEQPEVGAGAFAVVVADEAESGLVETPEARAERRPAQEPRRDEPRRDEPQRNERKPAEKKPEGNRKVAPPAPVADPAAAPAPEASPTPEPAAEAAKPRRSRSPRKPRSTEGSDTAPAQGPSDAAAE